MSKSFRNSLNFGMNLMYLDLHKTWKNEWNPCPYGRGSLIRKRRSNRWKTWQRFLRTDGSPWEIDNMFATKSHDDVIKWKHFPRYWPFVWGIHRSRGNSPHKGQWRWALVFSLIWVWINSWINNHEAGDLRRCRVHYDVIVMWWTLYARRVKNLPKTDI